MREGCPPTKICQHRFSGLHNTWFTHRDASAGFIYSLPGSFPLKQCTDQYVALFFFSLDGVSPDMPELTCTMRLSLYDPLSPHRS